MSPPPNDASDAQYAERLLRLQGVWWKRLLDVQRPYRWNLSRLQPGFTLDIGCGVGRNLKNLSGNGVGIDTNEFAVKIARSRGYTAFTPSAFYESEYKRPGAFDSLLLSHVLEHVSSEEASNLVRQYIEFVRPGGQLIIETPQELGFRSDPSHETFTDFDAIEGLCNDWDVTVERRFSFPLPRVFGHVFVYNEFVVIARLRG